MSRVLIVGGGIAGLTAAIALRRIGVDVEIVELKSQWESVSSGIFLQSNGLAMLRRLGVLPSILKSGFAVRDAMPVMGQDGEPITSVLYPRTAGPDLPATVGIKRSTLHTILASAADQAGARITLGTSVAALQPSQSGTSVETTHGATDQFALVIGADGVHSVVRSLALPDRAAPSESDFGVWRCIARRPKQLDEKIMMITAGLRLGIMPISDDELYLFGIVREGVGARFPPDEWAVTMRRRFQDFRGWAPHLLDAATSFHYAVIEEVDATPRWSNGCVLLIGDAAHATTPFMGQGASMAIEDSVVLADLLSADSDVWDSCESIRALLAAFEQRRRARVQLVQERSLAAGRAWGSDADAFSSNDLRGTMQTRVDELYAVLANPP